MNTGSVALRLRQMRRQRGLSLAAAVEAKTGLTKSYLSKVERGRTVPSIVSMLKIASAFGVKVGQLFGDSTVLGLTIPRTLLLWADHVIE